MENQKKDEFLSYLNKEIENINKSVKEINLEINNFNIEKKTQVKELMSQKETLLFLSKKYGECK